LAEEEILQARISELTTENATIQAESCDLMSKIKELTEQKATAESTNAVLLRDKQLSDTQKGIAALLATQ
jgi:predicted transcriptional regulator